jgi:hypothetical protein
MADAMMSGPPTTAGYPETRLRAAAMFFTVAVLLHNTDHLRRGGDSVSAQVFWLGSLAIVAEVAVVVLVVMRHPLAPLAAASIGFSLAFGYVGVHFTPDRSWASDSLLVDAASPLSQAMALLETTAAVVLGLAGVDALRRRGALVGAAGGPAPVSLRDALRHPLVLAMIGGNAVIFLGSLATR